MVLYSEKQKFDKAIIVIVYVILMPLISVLVYGLYKQTVLHVPFGARPASSTLIIAAILLCVFILFLFSVTAFEINISDKSIEYCWKPFKKKYSTINLSDVSSLEVIKFPFVGLGFRFSFKYGSVHVSNRNYGICIVLKNSTKLFIGISSPEKVEPVLKELNLSQK